MDSTAQVKLRVGHLGHPSDRGYIELMLDGNQRLTEPQALQIAAAIERLGFAWFEESIPQNDIAGYTRLNAALAIRVAGDEQWSTGQQLRPYLEPLMIMANAHLVAALPHPHVFELCMI